MAWISGRHGPVLCEGGRCDQKIVGTDHRTFRLEVGPNPGVDSRYFNGEGDDRKGRQNLFNESFPAAAAHGAVGSVDAMKKLRGRDRRESHGLISKLLKKV